MKKQMSQLDAIKSIRKGWGDINPQTRVERPVKGSAYSRKEKFKKDWSYQD